MRGRTGEERELKEKKEKGGREVEAKDTGHTKRRRGPARHGQLVGGGKDKENRPEKRRRAAGVLAEVAERTPGGEEERESEDVVKSGFGGRSP
jgi:hypothetical protein